MEVEVTWGRATRVWWGFVWGFVWRSLIINLIIGIPIALVLDVAGASDKTIQIVASALEVPLTIGIAIGTIKMILGKQFGEFRLVLVPRQTHSEVQIVGQACIICRATIPVRLEGWHCENCGGVYHLKCASKGWCPKCQSANEGMHPAAANGAAASDAAIR